MVNSCFDGCSALLYVFSATNYVQPAAFRVRINAAECAHAQFIPVILPNAVASCVSSNLRDMHGIVDQPEPVLECILCIGSVLCRCRGLIVVFKVDCNLISTHFGEPRDVNEGVSLPWGRTNQLHRNASPNVDAKTTKTVCR